MNKKIKSNSELSKNTIISNISRLYENNPFAPFVIAAMNLNGLGAVDRLVSKIAFDYSLKKLKILIDNLTQRVNSLEEKRGSEEFLMALTFSIRKIIEASPENKIK